MENDVAFFLRVLQELFPSGPGEQVPGESDRAYDIRLYLTNSIKNRLLAGGLLLAYSKPKWFVILYGGVQ